MAADVSTELSSDQPFVRLERVSRKYGTFRLALSEITLSIDRSELVLLIGGSGAGKSTLLRLVGAIDPPSSGRVRIGGEDPARMRPNELAFLRRSIGSVPQEPLLLDGQSVLENVMLPAIASNQTRREAVERARAALNRVRFDDVDALPGQLSSGARYRVALARAIVNRPALLLVDDPVSRLDADAADNMLHLLEQFAISGVTVVLAAQRRPERTPARSRLIRLENGVLA
ncbi:MAG TPA: ATP-binding cassette domain-containing protein [Burkholderiaceae bacterium]|nr:ATP-binding cassette domain-containing protein [Burkholderiaceae bacterium]